MLGIENCNGLVRDYGIPSPNIFGKSLQNVLPKILKCYKKNKFFNVDHKQHSKFCTDN